MQKQPTLPPPTETELTERVFTGAVALFLPFLQGGDLPTPSQMTEAAGFLSDVDFKAVEREIRLWVIDTPPGERNALKIAIFRRFEPFISLAIWAEIVKEMKARTGGVEDTVVMSFIRTVLDTRTKLLGTFKKFGICPYCGLSEALRDHITGATDWDLYRIIDSKGRERPDPAPCWIGSQSDGERFAKAAGLTARGFNYAFGRVDEKGRPDPNNNQPLLRFGTMKPPKEANTDNRHPQLLNILEKFGLVLPE